MNKQESLRKFIIILWSHELKALWISIIKNSVSHIVCSLFYDYYNFFVSLYALCKYFKERFWNYNYNRVEFSDDEYWFVGER